MDSLLARCREWIRSQHDMEVHRIVSCTPNCPTAALLAEIDAAIAKESQPRWMSGMRFMRRYLSWTDAAIAKEGGEGR